MNSCELCKSPAKVHCDSDDASLCWSCDAKVHSANFLVARHSRTLLCRLCRSPTPWTASGHKLGPSAASICDKCVVDGTSDDDDENNEYEGDEDSETELDVDEDDGDDNQVVPLCYTPPPPAASSSGSDDDDDDRPKRKRQNVTDRSEDDVDCLSVRKYCREVSGSGGTFYNFFPAASDEISGKNKSDC